MKFQREFFPEREAEFCSFVEAAVAQRKQNYSKLSSERLLEIWCLNEICTIQTSYTILSRISVEIDGNGPLTFEREILQGVLTWAREVTADSLFPAYCFYPHRPLFAFLINLQMEYRRCLRPELVRRLNGLPFSANMILLEDGQDRMRRVQKLLGIDGIKSRRPREQEDDDIKQSSLVRAWGQWLAPSESVTARRRRLPEFPIADLVEMLPHEKELWNGLIRQGWEAGTNTIVKKLSPIYSGEKEKTPEIVRRHRRTEWDRMDNAPKWDFSKDVDDIGKEDINPEQSAMQRELGIEAYTWASAKGEASRRFLDTLIDTRGNVAKASAAAGKSRVTGHKWRTELQTFLSKKNSPK